MLQRNDVRSVRRIAKVVVSACCCLLTAFPAEWREVFNPYRVLSLNLELPAADWDRVRNDQPSQSEGWVPEFAEASFWAEGETPIRVKIRRKGESDIPLPEGNPQKVSLKIDINDPVAGQKWRGLTKLSLENGGTDPLNEGFAWMAHRLATGMYGYEAANSAWVKLYVNGEFKGVFVNAEQRNTQFLQNHGYYKEGATWLYKVDGSASLESGLGHSATYNHLCYPPFNSGPGGGGGGNGGCTQPNLEIDLPMWINMRGFLTLAAVDAFVENTDALFSHSGKNSYAVDFDPPFPRTRMYFPWDLDTTIRQGDQSIYGNEPYQTTFLNHAWFGQVYEATLRELLAGPFSEAALHATINQLEQVLKPAFDADPYVYGGNSAEAFDSLRQWATRRVASVRSQLTKPFIARPVFNQNGGEVVAGFALTMSAPTGSVYYTLDGSDPRAAGGGISSKAQLYTGPVIVNKTMQVTARAFDGALWSGLTTSATFNIARYASALRITELMYHPQGDAAAGEDEYEFVELKNTGTEALDASGFYFEGIDYVFPAQTTIAPGAFYVIARNATAFARRYPGVTQSGVYWGKLSDSGEKIRLRNADGNTLISVEYDDDPPWVLSADGLGYSLVLAKAAGNPDDAETWRASAARNGSPGADDPEPAYGYEIVINEVLAHSDAPYEDAIELRNLSDADIPIGGWYLSDDFNRTNAAGAYDLKKYKIASGKVVPAGGYAVFYWRDFFEQNIGTPFALSEFGETVYLSSANASGELTGLVIGGKFEATERNVSFGRYRTSTGIDFTALEEVTFGVTNASSLNEFRSGSGAQNGRPKVGPVVINEIMYNPSAGGDEFVELLNISLAAVDISGWRLGGASFVFPQGTTMSASELVVLVNTNALTVEQFRVSNGVPSSVRVFGHLFVLENEGEALTLEKPNVSPLEPYIPIERVRYNDKSPWPTEADGEGPSLERYVAHEYGNDPVNWRTVKRGGSPGRVNEFPLGLAIARGSSWKYNVAGSELGTAWRGADYSDSSWPEGDGALGYGVPDLLTPFVLSASSVTPVTTWFRKEFVMNDEPSAVADLLFEARFDDGMIVYLNGQEVLRSASMPSGSPNSTVTTTSAYSSIGYETFDLTAHRHLLQLGRNQIAVELHQESANSSDAVWDAALSYTVSTAPTVAQPVITPGGGSFEQPVAVTITSGTGGAEIYYTLNGTLPDASSLRYTGAFTVSANLQVKARAFKDGFNSSAVASAEFNFVAANPDTDQDGLPDQWETNYFGNLAAEPGRDPDQDGLTNLEEYLIGTNPTQAGSGLAPVIVRTTSAGLEVRWASTVNTKYDVEWANALSGSAAFQPMGTNLLAAPPTNSFVIPNGAGGFFRIRAYK